MRQVVVTRTGRAGTTEDVAATVMFLASPTARHLTGQVIHVNGGAYLGR
jgi:3-oxoacyl-[acyl-carrier protein] reductase